MNSALLLIASFLLPLLFPIWFAVTKEVSSSRKKIGYWFASIWLILWSTLITNAIVPKPPTYTAPVSSDVYNHHPATWDFDLQSRNYQEVYYQRLRNALENKNAENNAETQNESSDVSSTNNPTRNYSEETYPAISPEQLSTNPMEGITIAEADGSPYTRADYGSGWDVGSGCNIRARILSSTSLVAVQTSNGCTVTYGSWIDPYSGRTLTGNPYRGDGTENDLDIDHIIPLKYVNSHGGYAWSSSQKIAYGKSLAAMDNGVYVAVSASENRKKSDKGPADYYPSNPDYYCEYSRKWRDIARLYQVSMSQRDYNKVEGVLIECGIL